MECIPELLEDKRKKDVKEEEEEEEEQQQEQELIQRLYVQIRKLTMKLNWVKKIWH